MCCLGASKRARKSGWKRPGLSFKKLGWVYRGLGFRVSRGSIGIMEKKMETTIMGYRIHKGHLGKMERKMESTIMGYIVFGFFGLGLFQ